jgi:hypothetical protein
MGFFERYGYIYTCMMNQNIQAILLKVVLELKKLSWVPGQDWEITLKSEGHVPLLKQVPVHGSMEDDEWRDDVETHMDLKMDSDDQITYFPDYTIYANIIISGGTSKDIVYKMDADVAFTEKEIKDDRKITECAKRINRLVDDHIEQEYVSYIDNNAEEIKWYKQSGAGKADDNEDREL